MAAILAGGVVAGQFGGLGDPEELGSAIREEPAIRVADIASERGLPAHGVFVQRTSTGHLCLWDAPSATAPSKQGGCNSADDPLGGRKLTVSFAYDGGPEPEDVRDARLIGLAGPDVAEVYVLIDDGSRRKMSLRTASIAGVEYQAFGHRLSKADLRRGGPTAVLALNEDGDELDRQATGLAG